VSEDDMFDNEFNLSIDEFGCAEIEGKPALPTLVRTYYLPSGVEIENAEVVSFDYIDQDLVLAPSRYMLSDNDTIGWEINKVKRISNSYCFAVDSMVSIAIPEQRYGYNCCRVHIAPIQYDSDKRQVRIYRDLSVLIKFNQDVEPLALNENGYLIQKGEVRQSYLALVPVGLEDTISTFLHWKKISGYNVIQEVRNSWTSDEIKSVIDSVYNEHNDLRYVLLVGDDNLMPAKEMTSAYSQDTKSYITDYYYSKTGDDNTVKLQIGRIPCSSTVDLSSALSKILKYEKTPPQDIMYYATSLHNADFATTDRVTESRRFVRTAEDVRDRMSSLGCGVNINYTATRLSTPKYWSSLYADGKELSQELQAYSWNGNKSTIFDYLNGKSLYMLYRGHGSVQGWATPGFSNVDISNLNVTEYQPIVFSITCLTGKFDYSLGCFAQQLLCKENGGCRGGIAASNLSYSGLNDAFTDGLFNQWYPSLDFPYAKGKVVYEPSKEPSFNGPTLGELFENGIARMYELYPSSPYLNYNRDILHIFGDPSMSLHTCVPKQFKNIQTQVETIPTSNGADYASAILMLKISLDEDALISVTDSQNQSIVRYDDQLNIRNPKLPVEIVVSGHNRIPYIYTFYDPQSSNIPSSLSNWHIVSMTPNPVSDMVEISVGCEGNSVDSTVQENLEVQNLSLMISSVSGTFYQLVNLDPATRVANLSTASWTKGNYVVALLVEGAKTDTKVLIKK
jgi:hypothetical protein